MFTSISNISSASQPITIFFLKKMTSVANSTSQQLLALHSVIRGRRSKYAFDPKRDVARTDLLALLEVCVDLKFID